MAVAAGSSLPLLRWTGALALEAWWHHPLSMQRVPASDQPDRGHDVPRYQTATTHLDARLAPVDPDQDQHGRAGADASSGHQLSGPDAAIKMWVACLLLLPACSAGNGDQIVFQVHSPVCLWRAIVFQHRGDTATHVSLLRPGSEPTDQGNVSPSSQNQPCSAIPSVGRSVGCGGQRGGCADATGRSIS